MHLPQSPVRSYISSGFNIIWNGKTQTEFKGLNIIKQNTDGKRVGLSSFVDESKRKITLLSLKAIHVNRLNATMSATTALSLDHDTSIQFLHKFSRKSSRCFIES